jgi:photosystem II stability/assembly factor-like uncharacterized protein
MSMSLTARVAQSLAAIAVICAATVVPATAAAWGAAGAPVPPGFQASSVTWLSPQLGWALGAVPCGHSTCSDVIGSTDGGTTWHQAGASPVPIANLGKDRPGVTGIRFATVAVGWAFGPLLLRTDDGGRSWARQPIPGGGKQVLDLAASSTVAYAIVSDCAFGRGLCGKPLSFWRTTPGAGTWTRVRLNLPQQVAADVAVHGKTVYVVDSQFEFGHPDVFYASTDGRSFSPRRVPCANAKDIGLVQAVPTSATHVAMLCDGNPGFSKAIKTVYTSTDTGRTDTFHGRMGLFGIQAQLAVSPTGKLAVASWSDGSFIYLNDTHARTWSMVEGIGDGGAGWNDITYVTRSTAWVVYGPAGLTGIGQLWVTHDGGQHWGAVTL